MAVYTRLKLAQIASECGFNVSPSILNNHFTDSRQDLVSIARLLMTTPLSLQRAIDLPEPPENRPLNWTAVGVTPCPYPGPWFGVAPIAYAHPFYPGFTYGAPVTLPIYF